MALTTPPINGENIKNPLIVQSDKPGSANNDGPPSSAPSDPAATNPRDVESSVEKEFEYFRDKAGIFNTNNDFIKPKKKATESWMNKYAFISYGGSHLDGSSGNVKNDFVGEGKKQTPTKGLNTDIEKWQNPTTKNIIEWSKTLRKNTPQSSTFDPQSQIQASDGTSGNITEDGETADTGNTNLSDLQTTSKGAIDRGNIGKSNAKTINDATASGNTVSGIGNLEYEWKDFAACKWWGRIPNNKMITLRRFKLPVLDNGVIAGKERLKAILKKNRYDPDNYITSDSARAITYYGEGTGNTLGNFTNWNVGANWEDIDTDLGNPEINKDGIQNGASSFLDNPIDGSAIVDKISGATNSDTLARIIKGYGLQKQLEDGDKKSLLELVKTQSKENDPFSNGWQNRIYGPINVVTRTMRRARGLKFEAGTIDINFEYEAAQIGTMNSKLLMIDIMNNMHALTYNNGSFYGGDYRFHRQPTELPYPETLVEQLEKMATGVGEGEVNYSEIFKAYKGIAKDYGTDLVQRFIKDAGEIGSESYKTIKEIIDAGGFEVPTDPKTPKAGENRQDTSGTLTFGDGNFDDSGAPSTGGGTSETALSDIFSKASGFVALLSKASGQLVDAIENNINKDGSLLKTVVTSGLFQEGYDIQRINEKIMRINPLTTGEPVGEWHVTVGNPMNPVMMIGNLVCTGMSMEIGETLGPDDFPTSVKFTVTLKHGRDRDIGDIMSMFNLGQGRFYTPLNNNQSEEPWDYGFSTRNTGNDTGLLDNDSAGRIDQNDDGTVRDPAPQDLSLDDEG